MYTHTLGSLSIILYENVIQSKPCGICGAIYQLCNLVTDDLHPAHTLALLYWPHTVPFPVSSQRIRRSRGGSHGLDWLLMGTGGLHCWSAGSQEWVTKGSTLCFIDCCGINKLQFICLFVCLSACLSLVLYPARFFFLENPSGNVRQDSWASSDFHTFAEVFARSLHLVSSPGLPVYPARTPCRKAGDEAL